MKILLIDDDPFALNILTRQLASLGFTDVVDCESASDAANIIETATASIDLVFCDLQMPRTDGVEFVRYLVDIGYTGGIVLVSGENERILQAAERLAKGHRLRVLGALHKPVALVQLRHLLEHVPVPGATASRPRCTTYEADELTRAITNNELENHYQPQVSVGSGEVIGVEALVRWRHPRDGLVFPVQFVGIAEEHDLIDDLTRVVLAGALRQARLWQDAGLSLQMAVNVSMDNLADLGFPDTVERTVAEAGVSTSRLVLEVTESRLMKDPMAQLDILTRLRLKHVGLSIDDFGTGHSSLAQLRDIPFHELKIDRGFVHGACRDASLRAIFQGSVDMARELGMKTVAEGVEDADDWDYLRKTGCDLAQGYFIAKPMPAEELVGWWADWRPPPEP